MSTNWMIEVLADLRKFAFSNGFLELAEQIDDTIHVATIELNRGRQEREENPLSGARSRDNPRPAATGEGL